MGFDMSTKKLPTKTVASWAEAINAEWRKTAAGFIRTGQLLLEAKRSLRAGDWKKLLEELDVDERKVQKLVRVAKNPIISKASNLTLLPPSLSTLDTLGQLDQTHLTKFIKKGDIHANMDNDDAKELVEMTKPKPAKEEAKPAKVERSRVADDAEVVEEEEEDDDPPAPTAKAKRNEPPKAPVEQALENFDSGIESLHYFCEQLETAMEEGGVKKLPKELQRKLRTCNELLSNWVRKYA